MVLVVSLVLLVSFAVGYFVLGPAKTAVTQVYATKRPTVTQTIVVGSPSATGTVGPRKNEPSRPATPAPADLRSPAPTASKTLIIQPEQRKRDYAYFTLATYPPATAQRLVAFWKSNGLDAAIVSDDNTGLVQVIDLRGFAPDQVGSQAFVKHEARLRELGRKWKSQEKGPDPLEHMNWAKFTVNVAPKPAARLKKD